ncbi:hypothetical protein GCM10011409_45910 [Lentibacillus populi]|uniref:Uncharacterized protein n=1 Tax=Lentibacillus populi TaxID=1827502 RepID=A0A9W5U255_9BACI|nr:hypothetical protein [Lentibacillus populi]GGB63670.1 hypothetical protein GCM10011409_45910 [Lentibacillus populi]
MRESKHCLSCNKPVENKRSDICNSCQQRLYDIDVESKENKWF